jgi:hypothetical protein
MMIRFAMLAVICGCGGAPSAVPAIPADVPVAPRLVSLEPRPVIGLPRVTTDPRGR